MKPPDGYYCDDCVAKPISFGGCHCRYVGQNPSGHPGYRFDVPLGWCQSQRAMLFGLMAGAAIEKRIALKSKEDLVQIQPAHGEKVPTKLPAPAPPGGEHKPIDVGDVYDLVKSLERRLDQALAEEN